jgi:hypothetical protein
VLSTIGNTLTSALSSIHGVQSGNQSFQKQVLFPLALIRSAQAQITSIKATYRSFLNTLIHFNPHAATLPSTQALELLIRDRQTDNLSSLQSTFAAAFRPLPQATHMSPEDRGMSDMDDTWRRTPSRPLRLPINRKTSCCKRRMRSKTRPKPRRRARLFF